MKKMDEESEAAKQGDNDCLEGELSARSHESRQSALSRLESRLSPNLVGQESSRPILPTSVLPERVGAEKKKSSLSTSPISAKAAKTRRFGVGSPEQDFHAIREDFFRSLHRRGYFKDCKPGSSKYMEKHNRAMKVFQKKHGWRLRVGELQNHLSKEEQVRKLYNSFTHLQDASHKASSVL